MKLGLKAFLLIFLGLFFVTLSLDLSIGRTNLSVRERLFRLEDICSYGYCIVIPFVGAVVVVATGTAIALVLKKLNKGH